MLHWVPWLPGEIPGSCCGVLNLEQNKNIRFGVSPLPKLVLVDGPHSWVSGNCQTFHLNVLPVPQEQKRYCTAVLGLASPGWLVWHHKLGTMLALGHGERKVRVQVLTLRSQMPSTDR